MTNKLLIMLSVFLLFVIVCLTTYGIYFYQEQFVWKFEVYENESEYLYINYYKNNEITFTKKSKDNTSTLCCGAVFLEENIAFFDGKNALPSMNTTYKLVFDENVLELYKSGEFVSQYNLIVSAFS